MARKSEILAGLPAVTAEYVCRVARRAGMSRKVRQEVAQELADHFRDALAGCDEGAERDRRAEQLVAEFGDAAVVGKLIRRGKKRCRPLWLKTLIRTFQAAALLILLYAGNVAWLVWLARPTISTNYLARLNEYVQPEVSEDQNARPYYQRATEAYVELKQEWRRDVESMIAHPEDELKSAIYDEDRSVASLTGGQRQRLEEWIAANQQAWADYAEGSRKPYYWVTYGVEEGERGDTGLYAVMLPDLRLFRNLGVVGLWQGRMLLEQGQAEEAVDRCGVLARVAAHLQGGHGTLIEQLVGMSAGRYSAILAGDLAASGKLSAAQLLRAQQEMEAAFSGGYPTVDFTFERIGFLDTVQCCFTDGGPGGGQIIPKQFAKMGATGHDWSNMQAWGVFIPLAVGRDANVAKGLEYCDKADQAARHTLYQNRQDGVFEWEGTFERQLGSSQRYLFVQMVIPSLFRAAELSWRARAQHEAAITILAAQRWRLEKGAYPQTLEELVAGEYLKAVPMDPYSAGPLVYRRTGEDFTLYSVGSDFADSGGVARKARDTWAEEGGGDLVFWPLQDATPASASASAPVAAP